MRVVLTGVPGTGKTAIASALSKKGFEVISLNEVVEKKKLWREVDEFGSRIVNLKKLERETNKILKGKKKCVVEGHLACEIKLNCDVAVVCRTKPSLLEKRLRERGYPERKVNENLMCELLDYCTVLSLKNYRRVYEIRSEGRVGKSVRKIMRIIEGKGERFRAGWVRWRRELERAATKTK
ncbi:MAG: adenylate kinase family protein [Candidatus Micrarchaeia archaeon]